ncbi:hypothetical protein BH09VER1_BH09VER1_38800 [soil metagenome]
MTTATQDQTTQTPATAPVHYITPRANLSHDAEGYVLELEMPGVDKDSLDVSVDDGKLVITGQRKSASELGRVVYRERRPASYRRVFELEASLDPSKVSAKIDQGLLTLWLPKPEQAKPHKITIS